MSAHALEPTDLEFPAAQRLGSREQSMILGASALVVAWGLAVVTGSLAAGLVTALVVVGFTLVRVKLGGLED